MDINRQRKRSRFNESIDSTLKNNNTNLSSMLVVQNDKTNNSNIIINNNSNNNNNNNNNNNIKNTNLFVGNIPVGIEGNVLQEFLNTAMKQSGLVPSDSISPPISNIRLSNKFGFLECIGVKETQAALNLNGIPFLNSYLKISRPTNFNNDNNQNQSEIIKSKTWQEVIGQPMLSDEILESIGVKASPEKSLETVTKSFRDIFVGNLSDQMTPDMIQEFLGDMLLKLGLAVDVTSNPIIGHRYTKGAKFAFMELRSMEEATNMLNLNNVPFMGNALKISRPSRLDNIANNNMPTFYVWDDLLTLWITGELKLLMSGQLSQAIRISGIVSTSMLLDEDTTEYDDMIEDTREECEQFGIVTSVIAPRPNKVARNILKRYLEEEEGRQLRSISNDANLGSIFVVMETEEEARDVLVALKGRTFDDQLVDVNFVPMEQVPDCDNNNGDEDDNSKYKIADIKTQPTEINTKTILNCLPRPVLTAQGVVPQWDILMLLKPLMSKQQINAFVSCGYNLE